MKLWKRPDVLLLYTDRQRIDMLSFHRDLPFKHRVLKRLQNKTGAGKILHVPMC